MNEEQSAVRQALSLRQGATRQPLLVEDEATVKQVVFILGGQRFAIPGSHIREILPLGAIHFVPGCPPSMEGVINVRGDIISVIRLSSLLRLEKNAQSNQGSILLGLADDMISGLLVEQVVDVLDLPLSAIHPPLHTLPDHLQALVGGTFQSGEQVVTILNLEQLFHEYRRGL